MIARFAMLLGVIGLAAACEQTPTQLLVFVHSDFPEGDLDAFGLRVVGPGEEVHDRGTFALLGDEPVGMPASFGVAPRGGDANRRVLLEVDAIDQGAVLFTTRARTSFVDREIVRLDMFLARRCRNEAQDCPANQTCGLDGCGPIDVPVEELRSPGEEPDPPQPSIEWTLWAEGTSGVLDTDEEGTAYVGLNLGLGGTVAVEGVSVELGPETSAVLARVKPDGALPWVLELRGTGGNARATISGVQASAGAVWIAGAAPDGFVVARDGEDLLEQPDQARLFVLRLTTDAEVEALATATTDEAVSIYGFAQAEDGDLAIGTTTQFPGTLLDTAWRPNVGGQGLLLRLAPSLDAAEACLWDETPSIINGVAPSGPAVATAGAASGAALARSVEPGCGILWTAFDGALGGYLSIAAAPGRSPCLLLQSNGSELSLLTHDPATGQGAPVPLVMPEAGWRLHLGMDAAGRVLASGATTGRIDYDGLSSGPTVPGRLGGFLLGTGPALDGRWLRRLESEDSTLVHAAVPDSETGAVVFVGSGLGEVRLDGVAIGSSDVPTLLVHRFVP